MVSRQTCTPSASSGVPLPPDFLTVEEIQNLPNEAIKSGQRVNLIGFTKDYQPPVQSRGTDFKCTFELVDSSVPYGAYGMKVNIFWPRENMPRIEGAGDAALVRNVKVQMWGGSISLLANFASEIHILPASKIPTKMSGSSNAFWRSYPPNKGKDPTALETAYVIETNSSLEDLGLPSIMEFQERSMQAMTLKDKFTLLQDVKPDHFYNILGEVVQVYDDGSYERLTVHLSDYTANTAFYNHAWGGSQNANGRDGDEHGYIKSRLKETKDWPGPYGKMTIQLTLFDCHASFVREQVKAKQWVLLRNVQIKYGKQGGRLEGFLRGDRNTFEGKVQVEVMTQSDEPGNDSRWKEAIARKYQWEKRFNKEKQALLDEAAGKKRKRDDEPPKANSKTRRKEKRAAQEAKVAAMETKIRTKLGLNDNIRCSNPDQLPVSLADILKPRNLFIRKELGRDYRSPFDVSNYKANVRIVDFFPARVEDFAVGRRPSEFDMLSDYSGGEDTDPGEDMRLYRGGNGFPEKSWEWRFALQVVDASSKDSTEGMWLMVGNHDAEMLLNLDATNLRRDKDMLRNVKEQLCLLWGDLEEQKSALARTKDPKLQSALSIEPTSSPPPLTRKPGDQPPMDSDDEAENLGRGVKMKAKPVNSAALGEQDPSLGVKVQQETGMSPSLSTPLQVKNKAFTCCIKQYGVKVDEDDPALANAGNGKRWVRRFGLFGTRIT